MKTTRIFGFLIFSSAWPALGDFKAIDGIKVVKLETSHFKQSTNAIILDETSALVQAGGFNEIYFVNMKSGARAKPLKMPQACGRISLLQRIGRQSRDLVCIGSDAKKNGLVQIYMGAGKFRELLKMPKPPSAIGGTTDRIFYVMGDTLFMVRPGEPAKVIFSSALLVSVDSLAVDSTRDMIFLSSGERLMVLRGGVLDVLIQDFGGSLSLLGPHLAVVNSKGEMYRVEGLQSLYK